MGEIQRYEGQSNPAPFAGKSGAAKAMARISASMKSRNFAEPALAKLAAADADRVLREIAASALDRAVSRFIAGQCGDGSGFAPTVAELAAEARRIEADDDRLARMRETFARPKQIAAPEPTDLQRERRAHVAAQARAMAHGWKSRDAAATPARYSPDARDAGMTRDEAAKAAAEWHMARAEMLAGLPVPRLSDVAIDALGLRRKPIAAE